MYRIFFCVAVLLFNFCFASNDFTTKQERIQTKDLSHSQILTWKNDLLFSHLYQQWLSKNIESISAKQATEFISNSEFKAAAWFFESSWWAELIRREDWPQVETALANSKDAHWACHYLLARQAQKKSLADAKIKSLWLTGKSQPDHCDPIFALWIPKQADADQLVWDRQIKAFYSRNSKLVRYLNRFYQSGDFKSDAAFLAKVYQDPKLVITQTYKPDSSRMREIALAAVNRMAFRDPRSASNLWLQIVKVTPSITKDEITKASRYLGIAMAKQALPEADYWLSIADSEKKDRIVQHWRLQIALSSKDYTRVLSLYQSLHSSLKQTDQWQYWSGIAQLTIDGYLKNDNPLYNLSQRRLYYGFLAAGVLGKEPSLNSNPNYAPITLTALEKKPSLKRAKALFDLGDLERAQVEWNLTVRNLDNQTQHAAAQLAFNWGWYEKSSQAAGWSGRYDLIDLRYPNAFQSLVEKYTDELNIPEYWVYGVMRQESRYMTAAVSHAGAHGLMQIMPATASQVSKRYKLPFSKTKDLHNPTTNIAIGSHYLDELLERYQHPVYATAAYNAGPSRIDVWQTRFPNEITIWIESIPFDETRNYVKSVMAYSQIYALTLNHDWHLASWLTPQKVVAKLDPQ